MIERDPYDMAHWTGTHYGRGTPDEPQVYVAEVIAAWARCGGPAVMVVDEDAGWIPEADAEARIAWGTQVHTEVARTPEEAVRVWWQTYGGAEAVDAGDEPVPGLLHIVRHFVPDARYWG